MDVRVERHVHGTLSDDVQIVLDFLFRWLLDFYLVLVREIGLYLHQFYYFLGISLSRN